MRLYQNGCDVDAKGYVATTGPHVRGGHYRLREHVGSDVSPPYFEQSIGSMVIVESQDMHQGQNTRIYPRLKTFSTNRLAKSFTYMINLV